MAVGWVQDWTGVTAASGDLAITGAALTAGNYIVFAVQNTGAADVISINGVAETAVLSVDQGATQLSVFIFKAVGGETSFTFTGNSANIWIVASEFSGIQSDQATAVDGSASTSNTSATTASTGTATVGDRPADSMAVAFLAIAGNTSAHSCADASASGGANYTLGSNATAGAIRLILAWKVLAVAEDEVGTWSWTTARSSCGAIIVLEGIASGGGGTALWTPMSSFARKQRRAE